MSDVLKEGQVWLKLNGLRLKARLGEPLLQVASRAGVAIPTLCHDERLKPAGVCRACLVEVEGAGRLQPACMLLSRDGLVVATETERVKRHRAVLYGLYLADHGQSGSAPTTRVAPGEAPTTRVAPSEALTTRVAPSRVPRGDGPWLLEQALAHGALQLAPVRSLRRGRPADENPYLVFDPQRCILCARCTRYCDEVEGVGAIALGWRGASTTVATAGMRGLLDTSCELCGGCIDTCPTGAIHEKKPLGRSRPSRSVRTTCNYCGVGCQLDLQVEAGSVHHVESPPAGTTVNDGNLCVKGRFAYDFIHHEDRLRHPQIRHNGVLKRVGWPEAIRYAAQGLAAVKKRHGANGLGFVSSSRCTVEENYLLQKLARAAFGTNNCHQCAAT